MSLINTAKLAELRIQNGLSMQELSERVGISQPMIALFEKGKRTPSLEVTVNMAEVLGVTVDELLTQPSGED